MTTEHVSVPRELLAYLKVTRDEMQDFSDIGHLSPKIGTLREWLKNVDAILSRATPNHKGEVVVTKNEQGQIVAVTRQDEDGQILSVIAESTSSDETKCCDYPNCPNLSCHCITTSAPRVVTDAHVAVAEHAYMDAFNTRQNRMRAALQSFATSLPASVPDDRHVVQTDGPAKGLTVAAFQAQFDDGDEE